ncbi:MAG: DUF2807 domain-containing protein [Armatimonadetes bacterium]|nr:DUF2807 domain-containing protein [Armatimonadota bacterium]
MKPGRFLALLVMVGILAGLFGMVVFGIVGFKKGMSSFAQSFDDFSGERVSAPTTVLQGTYESLGVSGPMDVTWQRAAKASFDVKCRPDTLKRIKYRLEDKSLEIHLTGKGDPGPVSIVVKGPQPASFSLAGSGDCVFDGLKGADFDVSVAGSGDVTLSGTLDDLQASIAGSGNLKADRLLSKSAEISIAGSGDAQVGTTDKLEVTIAGSGDVVYRGHPTVSQDVFGSGSVKRRE